MSAQPDEDAPRLQRAAGRVAVSVEAENGRTRLKRLHQAGCLKLRFPRLPDGNLEGVLINTAGGLTGGDRLHADYAAGAGATLVVTTQAAERVYRAASGMAEAETSIRIGEHASFAFLPQETILFDGGRLRRRLSVDGAATSRFFLCESVILGRQMMGERVGEGLFRDSWRVRRDGRLVFAEELRLAGDIEAVVRQKAALAGRLAFATVLCQTREADAALATVRDLLGTSGGASLVEGLLVARFVAPNGFALRKRLVPLLSVLANGPLPRVWSL